MQQAPHPQDSIIPEPNPEEQMAPRSDQKEEMEEAAAGGQSQADLTSESGSESFQEDDAEAAELARLRCESVRTEEKKQPGVRTNRSVDYPGLAFGSAMFGSDTMMKFNIIKNELHNIMRSQLKRVDGEVTAMAQRIKALDHNLELSEQYIKTATATLAEAVQHERDHDPVGSENDDSALSQFDAQMALLGHRLLHAKMLAAEAAGENEQQDTPTTVPSMPTPVTPTPVRASILTPAATAPSPSSQNCLLSTPALPAPLPLRRPFSAGPTPRNE